MSDLVDRLHSWAQNEEMVDASYTQHGKDCKEAADEIASLTAEVERLGRCLRIAAGMLSTTREFARRHPADMIAFIEAAEAADPAKDVEPSATDWMPCPECGANIQITTERRCLLCRASLDGEP